MSSGMGVIKGTDVWEINSLVGNMDRSSTLRSHCYHIITLSSFLSNNYVLLFSPTQQSHVPRSLMDAVTELEGPSSAICIWSLEDGTGTTQDRQCIAGGAGRI